MHELALHFVLAMADPGAGLETAVATLTSGWESDGASGVLLVDDGHAVIQRGFGQADRERAVPNGAGTGFDIGSLVKEFTFVAIHQLAESGRLSLEDTLDEHFDAVPADKRGITIQQILTHRSGLADIVDESGKSIEYAPEVDFEILTREQMVERLFKAPLVQTPADEETYSNFGYGLLAAIVEKISGLGYVDYVEQRVFGPAGMTRTGYAGRGWQVSNVAVGYRGNERWGITLGRTQHTGQTTWMLVGSGGMISTAADYARFIRALGGGKLVGPAGLAAYRDYFGARLPSGEWYALSFGSNDVYWAGYFWAPERDVVIVLYTNDREHSAESLIGPAWKVIRERTTRAAP